MASQQSMKPISYVRSKKRNILPRLLIIIITIACVLTLLSFVGAAIFWIGLIHDKLSDTLSAIFTVLGTIFGFIALVLAIPPFVQYLRERQAVVPFPISSSTNIDNHNHQFEPSVQQSVLGGRSTDSPKAQSHFASEVRLTTDSQLPSTSEQLSRTEMSTSIVRKELGKLTFQKKSELVDKLLACSTMRDKSLRNIVVEELSFANSILRDSKATNKEDLMTIVNRCLDFSDGLQQLVERIKYHEDDSLPVQQLETFVRSLS